MISLSHLRRILVVGACFQLAQQYRNFRLHIGYAKSYVGQPEEAVMLPPNEWKVHTRHSHATQENATHRQTRYKISGSQFKGPNPSAQNLPIITVDDTTEWASSTDDPFVKLLKHLEVLTADGNEQDSAKKTTEKQQPASFPRHQEVYFALPRQKQVDRHDTTVAVHTSIHKLNRLLFLIHRWGGPVSAAIYITNKQDLAKLETFYRQHGKTSLYWTDIHVFLEREDDAAGMGYPHNTLRNMALEGIQDTDYFLALDVDFVTNPPNAHSMLKAKMQSDPGFVHQLRNNKTLMVLPAFNREGILVDESNVLEIGKHLLPKSKQEALGMIQREYITPFHMDVAPAGHKPTRFARWIRSKSNSTFYPIKFTPRFEPYVLGYKPTTYNNNEDQLPKCWPGFRGFGFNKLSWFVEAYYSGFQYAVLRDFFVIHFEHETSNRVFSFETIHQILQFHNYMKRVYNLTQAELDEFGPPPAPLARYYRAMSLSSSATSPSEHYNKLLKQSRNGGDTEGSR